MRDGFSADKNSALKDFQGLFKSFKPSIECSEKES